MGSSIGQTKQIRDPFQQYYNNGNIIMPEYDPEVLARLSENSDILQTCIEAYKTNIVGFGYNLQYNFDEKEEKNKLNQANNEWSKYDSFLRYCNFDDHFAGVLKKFIDDRERIGYATIECIEDETGEIAELQHIPAYTVRICTASDPIEVEEVMQDIDGKDRVIKRWKRFKKFIQMIGNKQVYFKEIGDPRTLNKDTGEYFDKAESVAESQRANSIIFDNIYCPYTEYGMPRYMGTLIKLMGSRAADEINLNYFEEGRHIPLAIVVENGQLTQDSIDILKESKGEKSQHKYLVLEAEAFKDGFSMNEKTPQVKIHFEKLAEIMQKDALFLEYLESNRNALRSSFRLTPIYTGDSDDYTRATAETSKQITEEQVFEPEREDLANLLNKKLMKALGIRFVELKFKAPKTTDDTEIANALTPYINANVATPNMLLDSLGKLLGKEYEPFTEEWGDVPVGIYNINANRNNVIKSEKDNVVNLLKELQATIEGALDE